MTRWIILGGCLALWLGCLGWIDFLYRPATISKESLEDSASLEALFFDSAPEAITWDIYAKPDPSQGNYRPALGIQARRHLEKMLERQAEWAREKGAGEGEVWVGALELKHKKHDFMRVEQYGLLRLDLHDKGFGMSWLPILGRARWESWATYDREAGLVEFRSKLRLAHGIQLEAHGVAEDENLEVTVVLKRGEEDLPPHRLTLPRGARGAPNVNVTPFRYRPHIHAEDAWKMAYFNPAQHAATPQMVEIQARVTAVEDLAWAGRTQRVYRVEAKDDATALTAWYTVNGQVLKQRIRLLGLMDATLIRRDPDAEDPLVEDPLAEPHAHDFSPE